MFVHTLSIHFFRRRRRRRGCCWCCCCCYYCFVLLLFYYGGTIIKLNSGRMAMRCDVLCAMLPISAFTPNMCMRCDVHSHTHFDRFCGCISILFRKLCVCVCVFIYFSNELFQTSLSRPWFMCVWAWARVYVCVFASRIEYVQWQKMKANKS